MGNDTTLADYLRYLRISNDYTQQEIANLLGVSRSTYTYYETGKTEPNIDTLKRLSQIYKVSVTDLILNRKTRSEIMADSKLTIDRTNLNKPILTVTEYELISQFRKLSPQEKSELISKLKDHVKENK